MKFVSVIVPVYNVEKYVAQCIESVLNQTYSFFELILVNDGSTDSSAEICESYSSHKNVRVFHKENGGLSSARNFGIKYAKGEYLTFLDSDDYISSEYLADLVFALEASGTKIAMCKYTRKKNDFTRIKSNVDVLQSDIVLKKILYQNEQELYSVAACAKLYKKSLFNELRYPEGKINEDMFVICEIMKNVEKVAVCHQKDYYYRVNVDSITQRAFTKKNMDVIAACEYIMEFVQQNYSSDGLEKAAISMAFRRNFQMLTEIWKSTSLQFEEEEKAIVSNLHKYKRVVLIDKRAKFSSRMVALFLFLGNKFVKSMWLIRNYFY